MGVNIWGVNPKTKKAEIFALAMPAEAVAEKMMEARQAGWTNITTGKDARGYEDDASVQHEPAEK